MGQGALIPLVWDVCQWTVPTAHCTHWEDLHIQHTGESLYQQQHPRGEVFPHWHRAPFFSSLSSPLQCTSISLQPVLDVPPAPLDVLIEELSNVQNGQGGWTEQGPGSFNCPVRCGQQPAKTCTACKTCTTTPRQYSSSSFQMMHLKSSSTCTLAL